MTSQPSSTSNVPLDSLPGIAAQGLELEHVFDIRIDFDIREQYGPLPSGGTGGFTRVRSGIITGPRLNGRVMPQGGADWATIRPDGVIDLRANYMLEADDGTLIHIQNRGYLIRAEGGPESGSDVQPQYFRIAPEFRVAVGTHDWLTRTVFVGTGERHWDPDHSVFHYFAVR